MCVISKKLDFSDDEDQLNEKLNKQSLNGDIRSRSDNTKGYLSNKICDPSLVQNLKVKNSQFDLLGTRYYNLRTHFPD